MIAMRDNDRVRRGNRIILVVVILFLLYGIIYRVQTGDNKLYLFGYAIDLPFGQQETTGDTQEAPDSRQEVTEGQQETTDSVSK